MVSQAQNHSVSAVGSSMPVWTEHRASVNDDGIVAWTHLSGSSAEARVWDPLGPTLLHPLVTPSRGETPLTVSFAQGIADDGSVVGVANSSLAGTVREAKLWPRNGSAYSLQDLHASLPATMRLSQANGVIQAGVTNYTIVGWARERVANAFLPKPWVWNVQGATVTSQQLPLTEAGLTFGYGDARSVGRVDRDGAQWACGIVGAPDGGMSYSTAACWDLAQASKPLHVIPDVTYSAGFATSYIERVRSYDFGDGVVSIAVGAAIDTSGAIHPFALNVTTGQLDFQVKLLSNGSGLLVDVGRVAWSTQEQDQGPVFYGAQTVTVGPLPVDGGPISMSMNGLRGSYQAKPGIPIGEGDVCLMDRALDEASPSNIVASVSDNGKFRVIWSNGQLSRLEEKPPVGDLSVYVRDTQVRTTRAQTSAYTNGSTATKIQYYWGDAIGSSYDGSILWGDHAGCAPLVAPGQSGCDPNAVFALSSDDSKNVAFSSAGAGHAITALTMGARPSSLYRYVQLALRQGATCGISNVQLASDLELVNTLPTQSHEAGAQWEDCYPGEPGYDTDVMKSFDHCGVCVGGSCARANMDSWCSTGTCQFGACDIGWVDLNANVVDGCECPIQNGGVDLPGVDGNFADENCDGVDGNASNSIFVATSWGVDNASCGTRIAPCATIQHGINRASAGMDVLVAGGTYIIHATLNLKNNVGVHGGYAPVEAGSWARSASYETKVVASSAMAGAIGMEGNLVAVRGQNLSASTILSYLSIETPDLSGQYSSSNYGLQCVGCAGLQLHRMEIVAGRGSAGPNGPAGTSAYTLWGAPNNGAGGGNGSCDGGCYLSWGSWKGCQAGGSGGNGGARQTACSTTTAADGGRGGNGGHEDSGNGNGVNGATGGAWGGNGGGSGSPGGNGQAAGVGVVGGVGAAGVAGIGGASTTLNTAVNLLGLGHGHIGGLGVIGRGGGGGGGGGAQRGWNVNDGPGNGGGGGGAGGCGGGGGIAGQGGGHSVGAILVSSGGASVVNTIIQTYQAGAGGNGGFGGEGRAGASGANGAQVCTSEVGGGGRGGNGGTGGVGGRGGGGAGGNSVPVVTAGGTVTITAGTRTSGGLGIGGAGGFNGQSGVSQPVLNL